MGLIDSVMINIGAFFMIAGGIVLVVTVVGFVIFLTATLWISASNKWRAICRAESLVFEYKRNQQQFLKWKNEQHD